MTHAWINKQISYKLYAFSCFMKQFFFFFFTWFSFFSSVSSLSLFAGREIGSFTCFSHGLGSSVIDCFCFHDNEYNIGFSYLGCYLIFLALSFQMEKK